jgi:hypothetical protein
MTTYITFSPSPTQPFQFSATLDGTTYNVIVTWNLAAQRWYLNIYNLNGTLFLAIARIGSPLGDEVVNMVKGYCEVSTLIYRTPNNQFEISP